MRARVLLQRRRGTVRGDPRRRDCLESEETAPEQHLNVHAAPVDGSCRGGRVGRGYNLLRSIILEHLNRF